MNLKQVSFFFKYATKEQSKKSLNYLFCLVYGVSRGSDSVSSDNEDN